MQVQDSPALLPELSGMNLVLKNIENKSVCGFDISIPKNLKRGFSLHRLLNAGSPLVSLIQNFADLSPCSSPAACQSLPQAMMAILWICMILYSDLVEPDLSMFKSEHLSKRPT